MSRHSHWAKIKRAKGADDAKKGAAFTKLSRAITIAGKEGGTDPDMNFKLRLAIDAARAQNMPKDTIDRAIARAAGAAGEGALSEVLYEAFGPAGVGLLIEAVTDNKNRTSSNIKHILDTHGGALGAPGSVVWQFDHRGVVRLSPSPKGELEGVTLSIIEAGALDIFEEDDDTIIQTAPESLKSVLDVLASKHINVAYSGLDWVPKNTVEVSTPELQEKLESLLGALEDDEDVARVASNET